MREIKFRVWDEEDCTMEIVDSLINTSKGMRVSAVAVDNEAEMLSWKWEYKDSDHIMQYTGLKDKNGVEIYEGDICINVVADSKYGIVHFEDGMFIMRTENGDYIHHYLSELCKHSEVIGNIYENPELF